MHPSQNQDHDAWGERCLHKCHLPHTRFWVRGLRRSEQVGGMRSPNNYNNNPTSYSVKCTRHARKTRVGGVVDLRISCCLLRSRFLTPGESKYELLRTWYRITEARSTRRIILILESGKYNSPFGSSSKDLETARLIHASCAQFVSLS